MNNAIPIISNRCFELLLLLHVIDLEEHPKFVQEIIEYSRRNQLLELLRNTVQKQEMDWVNLRNKFENTLCERSIKFYKLYHKNINVLLANLAYIEIN